MKKILYFLPLLFLATMLQAQQEHQFTQFMHNKLVLNPGYAGTGPTTISALYRKQWVDFDGAPESKLLSFHTNLVERKVGFGLTIANYNIGIFDSYSGHMAYSYRIEFNEKTDLRLGLHATLKYLGIDFDDRDLVVRQQNDPSIEENTRSDEYKANFGFGAYLQVDNFYAGASVPNLYPNEIGVNSFSLDIAKELPHVYFMAGAAFPINEKMTLQPELLAKYVQNAPFDLDLNVTLAWSRVLATGVAYRVGGQGSGESIDFLVYVKVQNFGIGGAYDFTLTDIQDYSSGTFEVVLKYEFKKEQDNLSNPRFFF